MTSAVQGFAMLLSLIIAIGAQNVFVLRQGLRREHVLLVVAICALSDAVLIAAGVGGLGVLVRSVPGFVDRARGVGAVFLLGYAALTLRRVVRPVADAVPELTGGRGTGVLAVAGTTLALTWLNPHVYLDTVLLLGSVAQTQGEDRWAFALGAMVGSVLWFGALGFGARLLAPVLRTPRAWRVLDGVVVTLMVLCAVLLVRG
jgi:L-lysine exporter family protein LysE/ArgO